MVQVQSITISKNLMSKTQAKNWIRANKFKVLKVDSTKKSWRFRQLDPGTFKRFRSKIISPGVVFIFGVK